MPHIYDISSYALLLVPLAALFTWIISVRIYPVIIYISEKKNLMDEPDGRSSHTRKTPTLGGVGMFLSFSVALLLCGVCIAMDATDLIRLISVIATTIILLFLGIKDDLLVIAPKKKFMGQILAAGIVIVLTDVRITGFGGLIGISDLPYWASVLFSLFVFLVVINAFNLIDGIDGLAGCVATFASLAFGTFFLVNGQHMLALLSFSLVGALLGFLTYNLSRHRKLFMGDSGSLFLGYLLAYQGMSFLMVNHAETSTLVFPHAPILLLAVLSFPLMDCLRVFSIRIASGKNPFHADRNHIHHRFLHLGFSHRRATATILAGNVVLTAALFAVNHWDPTLQLVIGFVLGGSLYLFPFLVQKRDGVRVISLNTFLKEESEPVQGTDMATSPIMEKRTRIFSEILRKRPAPMASEDSPMNEEPTVEGVRESGT